MASTSASVESSTVASVESNMVVLNSSDGETFEVQEKVIMQSETIKHMIEDLGTDTAMPVPNVTGTILAKVIEYCKKHVDDSDEAKKDIDKEEKKTFDKDFVKVDQVILFDLILAANYLNIKSLLDITCQAVADMIKDKSPEEIRKTFNIVNDFTPDEEKEIRKENAWAFE